MRSWSRNIKVNGKCALLSISLILLSVTGLAADKAAQKNVDSGSFGVYMGGRRIATETFTIHQDSSGSEIKSEFKTENTSDNADQSCDLQLAGNGDIKKYEWKELSPGQSQATVVPNDNFIIMRSSQNQQQKKPAEEPFMLGPSINILDDYFFVQREVLIWKFLATSCKQEAGQVKCPEKQRTQMGVFNPHAHSSMQLSVEFDGRSKISIHGTERELNAFTLKSDAGDWNLWLDDQFKLIRIVVPGDNTEVLRD